MRRKRKRYRLLVEFAGAAHTDSFAFATRSLGGGGRAVGCNITLEQTLSKRLSVSGITCAAFQESTRRRPQRSRGLAENPLFEAAHAVRIRSSGAEIKEVFGAAAETPSGPNHTI